MYCYDPNTPQRQVNGDQVLFGLMISEGSIRQDWEGAAEQGGDVDLVERMQRTPQEVARDRMHTHEVPAPLT